MGINEYMYNSLTLDNFIAIPTNVKIIHKKYSYIKNACIKKNYYETITNLYELEYMVSGIIQNMGYNPNDLLNMLYEKNMVILRRKIAKRKQEKYRKQEK